MPIGHPSESVSNVKDHTRMDETSCPECPVSGRPGDGFSAFMGHDYYTQVLPTTVVGSYTKAMKDSKRHVTSERFPSPPGFQRLGLLICSFASKAALSTIY